MRDSSDLLDSFMNEAAASRFAWITDIEQAIYSDGLTTAEVWRNTYMNSISVDGCILRLQQLERYTRSCENKKHPVGCFLFISVGKFVHMRTNVRVCAKAAEFYSLPCFFLLQKSLQSRLFCITTCTPFNRKRLCLVQRYTFVCVSTKQRRNRR